MRRGLLIACSDYCDDSFTPLRFPLNDAALISEILADEEFCGFGDVDILKNPTKAQAHRAIEKLTAHSASDDLILLYFSGHGKLARDGSLALVLTDTEEAYLHSTSIVDDELRALFNAARARHKVIILDCCHSGAVGEEGFKGAEADAIASMALQVGGTFILTASTKFQPAFECSNLEQSALTACLVDGIRSGAAAGAGGDVITLSQLGEFLVREVPRRYSQQPRFWDCGGVGVTPFARVPKRFDAAWVQQSMKSLKRMLADDEIDEQMFDDVRAVLRQFDDPGQQHLMSLIGELAEGKIRPMSFVRRWPAPEERKPAVPAPLPDDPTPPADATGPEPTIVDYWLTQADAMDDDDPYYRAGSAISTAWRNVKNEARLAAEWLGPKGIGGLLVAAMALAILFPFLNDSAPPSAVQSENRPSEAVEATAPQAGNSEAACTAVAAWKAAHPRPADAVQGNVFRVHMDDSDRLYWEGVETDFAALSQFINMVSPMTPQPLLVVTADPNTSCSFFLRVTEGVAPAPRIAFAGSETGG